MKVAYTNHIGRSSRDNHSGKNTAIFTVADLAATEKHNNHDYAKEEIEHMQSAIDLDQKHLNRQYEMVDGKLTEVKGHLNLEENVRKIYDEQFSDAVAQYNLVREIVSHPERQVKSYIDKVSEGKQQEVAVEGLLQIGSLEDWEGRSLDDRIKAGEILLCGLNETLNQLKKPTSEFVLAGASLHLNEGCPHLHYVGVPVYHTPDAKKGMIKRVKKSAVFTKYTLGTGLQDNVREKLEPMIEAAFGWEFEEKKSGRNEDLDKNRYVNDKLQEQIRESEQKLNDIELTIHEVMNNLEENLMVLSLESIEAAAIDHNGAYGNALFLLDACSEERFEALSNEGLELKKSFLGEAAEAAQVEEVLDDRILSIVNGKVKVRMLSWEERKKRWLDYQDISDDFWRYREWMARQRELELQRWYKERRLKRSSYNRAIGMLIHSRTIIGALIFAAWAVVEIEKERVINKQIGQVRKERAELIQKTGDFAKYSAAFREDLKAGKAPDERYMDAMADAVRTLDAECQKFQQESKQRGKQLPEFER